MPKQTFFNLPDEKRGHIIHAAVDEFAEYGLENCLHKSHCGEQRHFKGQFLPVF